MGPFPHDAEPPVISTENPMGTDGFEFVEFCHPDPSQLDRLFRTMGFVPVARHRSKDVTLYRQGRINLIVNAEPGSFAANFAAKHGPSAPAMAFRVVDAKQAFARALSLGAKAVSTAAGPGELPIPAIEGIGGLHIYLVDRYGAKGSIYDVDFEWLADPTTSIAAGSASGPGSTSACSTSGRSATSILPASSPACTRGQ